MRVSVEVVATLGFHGDRAIDGELLDLKLQSFVRRRSPSKERAWGATKGMKTLWNIFIGSRWSDRAGGYAVSSASGHKTDHY